MESIAEEKVKYWKTLGWIVHEAKPEWLLLTIGVICAMLGSTSFPVFSILMADYYGVSIALTTAKNIVIICP